VDKINSRKNWINERKQQRVDEVVDLQGLQEVIGTEETHARKNKSRITI
jgi:hypothetical protein